MKFLPKVFKNKHFCVDVFIHTIQVIKSTRLGEQTMFHVIENNLVNNEVKFALSSNSLLTCCVISSAGLVN